MAYPGLEELGMSQSGQQPSYGFGGGSWGGSGGGSWGGGGGVGSKQNIAGLQQLNSAFGKPIGFGGNLGSKQLLRLAQAQDIYARSNPNLYKTPEQLEAERLGFMAEQEKYRNDINLANDRANNERGDLQFRNQQRLYDQQRYNQNSLWGQNDAARLRNEINGYEGANRMMPGSGFVAKANPYSFGLPGQTRFQGGYGEGTMPSQYSNQPTAQQLMDQHRKNRMDDLGYERAVMGNQLMQNMLKPAGGAPAMKPGSTSPSAGPDVEKGLEQARQDASNRSISSALPSFSQNKPGDSLGDAIRNYTAVKDKYSGAPTALSGTTPPSSEAQSTTSALPNNSIGWSDPNSGSGFDQRFKERSSYGQSSGSSAPAVGKK